MIRTFTSDYGAEEDQTYAVEAGVQIDTGYHKGSGWEKVVWRGGGEECSGRPPACQASDRSKSLSSAQRAAGGGVRRRLRAHFELHGLDSSSELRVVMQVRNGYPAVV